jgi:hypothetical protein
MSLRVWLPLLSDAHNQGASDIIPTVMGTGITYTAGKLGNAATFPNSCASCIHMPGLKLQVLSWCCWFKCTGEGSATSQRMLSEGRDTGSVGTNIWLSKAGTTLYWSAHKVTGSTTVALNTWYHVALTCDGSKVHLYLDGKEIGTGTAYSEDSDYAQSNDSFVIGKMAYSYTAGGNYFPFCGQMNDVRIYDHCLSAAEVKEIAQGLVLHYKLDKIPTAITNAYSTPYFDSNANAGGWSHWGRSGHAGSFAINTDPQYIYYKDKIRSHSVTNGAGATGEYLVYQSPAFEGGYRSVQCIVKEQNSRPITKSILFPAWNGRDGGAPGGEWTHVLPLGDGFYLCQVEAVHQNGNDDLIGFYVCPGYTVYFSAAWCENDREFCSDVLFPTDVIEDSSGYGHHGSTLNEVEIASDPARYESCTHLVAGNSMINCGRGGMVTDSITVNIWLKASGWNNPVSCTEGGGWNFEANNGYFRFPVYIQSVGYKYMNTTKHTTAQIANNQWHMLTGVYDRLGQKIHVYVDGEIDSTANTGSSNPIAYHASNVVWIGGEATGSSTAGSNGMAGYFSDFRIYATALSADDILELYHTSAKIDNLGGVHTFELVESEGEHITKQGLIETDGIYENGYQSILQYDKNIYTEPDGSTWVHVFHHNNPSGGRFTNSTADWSDGVYIDANRWYDVEKMLYNLVKYEFMVKQKTTSDATENKWRWVQNINPMDATWATVGTDACVYNTSSGYATSSYKKGMYIFKTSDLHMCIANNTNGNWYGGIGAAAAFNGGIPGYPNTTVTTGYIDLYVRVYLPAKIIQNTGFSALEFIEK